MRRVALAGASCVMLLAGCGRPPQERAEEFLRIYDGVIQKMYKITAEAYWKSATDVTEMHVGERIGAEKVMGSFSGNPWVIETVRDLLDEKESLDDLTVRQLQSVLLSAAEHPGTVPEIVEARVTEEAQQGAILDSFQFCAERAGDNCVEVVTPNQIDQVLVTSRDEAERRRIWEVSKQTGPALKQGIDRLRNLRNQVAREMGFDSFFALQVADYGMTVDEMMVHDEALQRGPWALVRAAPHMGQARAGGTLPPGASRHDSRSLDRQPVGPGLARPEPGRGSRQPGP